MSKAGILTLMVLFLSLHDARGKPLSDDDAVNRKLIRNTRTFGSNLLQTPFSRHFWTIPNSFKDDTNGMTVLMKKVETIEENQENILEVLRQLTEAPKATPCISPPVPTSNDHSEKMHEDTIHNELKQIIDILNGKGDKHEDTNQYEMSDSKNKVNYNGSLSITVDGNGTTPVQTVNEVVVKPLQSNNSQSELNYNEDNDKELMEELEILENYSMNKNVSLQSNNLKLDNEMSDSKNKVNYNGSLSITVNGNGTTPVQTVNEVVVKPLQSNNSQSELNYNEDNDKELMEELEILENYSMNKNVSLQSSNLKLDSNEDNAKELVEELDILENYSINKNGSSQSNNLKLDSNEDNAKELVDELEKLENYSINKNNSSQSNNLKLDSNEDNKKELEKLENYSINKNESSQSSNLKLDSNENNDKELVDELEKLENYTINKNVSSQSDNLKLDSNEDNDKEVESLIQSKYLKVEQLMDELEKLRNYWINEKKAHNVTN